MSGVDTMDRVEGPSWALVADGPLRGPLLVATAVVALAGLAAEIAEYELGAAEWAVELFSLSYEANVPTWYATVLLFACSAQLANFAREQRGLGWWVLSGVFAYISLDEAIEIHEYLGWLVDGEGLFYFGWVLPAGALTLLAGLAYVPFLRALSASTRRRFLFAAAVYVGGALCMEVPLGWWVETYGDDNLGYGVIDFVEESMELFGTSFFLLALAAERAR